MQKYFFLDTVYKDVSSPEHVMAFNLIHLNGFTLTLWKWKIFFYSKFMYIAIAHEMIQEHWFASHTPDTSVFLVRHIGLFSYLIPMQFIQKTSFHLQNHRAYFVSSWCNSIQWYISCWVQEISTICYHPTFPSAGMSKMR